MKGKMYAFKMIICNYLSLFPLKWIEEGWLGECFFAEGDKRPVTDVFPACRNDLPRPVVFRAKDAQGFHSQTRNIHYLLF